MSGPETFRAGVMGWPVGRSLSPRLHGYMLLHQARPGFAAWFGVEPRVTDVLRAHVCEGL